MRLPKHVKTKSQLWNMTPMLDVVFLLLIFFIVSSNLMRQDVTVPMELPEAQSGREEKPAAARLTLNIPQSGQLLAGTTPITPDELRQILTKMQKKSGKNIELRIRTGKDVPYSETEAVLVIAAETGIADVTFSVKNGLK
ncbi:MAG: biopolymer transporter ExbD [Planctomycetaceae bacterium]|jgi:biopolymer transport protein ExbD|nr:biopolymer transporter ExbD [Planctomycetaceae bacterium]